MRSSRAGALAGAVIAAVLVSGTATADVTAPLYAKMKQRLTATKPGVSSGWTFEGALKPVPEGEQVPPQRKINIVFPPGTRVDPRAARACRASDDRLGKDGLGACPRRSRIGSGELELFLGPGSTLAADVAIFAAGRGILFVLTANGAVVRVIHLSVSRNRIYATVEPLRLANGYQAAIMRAKLRVRPRDSGKRTLIRTPARCPRDRAWTITYLPRYDEPHGVQRSTSSTPCIRGAR